MNLDIAVTKAHLEDAEERYRVEEPFSRQDIVRDIVELGRRQEALLDELAYLDAKAAMLDEDSDESI